MSGERRAASGERRERQTASRIDGATQRLLDMVERGI
ncbi:hypothetical protein ABIE21_001387 [Conyzicola nivalis]|uniref:Uncharacterized protein n=1 Tax=Conyzicola nivalis TaxID=1477021 RepID=A0ABV2QLG0_9MICO